MHGISNGTAPGFEPMPSLTCYRRALNAGALLDVPCALVQQGALPWKYSVESDTRRLRLKAAVQAMGSYGTYLESCNVGEAFLYEGLTMWY
jgi:hypothetical protein